MNPLGTKIFSKKIHVVEWCLPEHAENKVI